MKVTTKCLGPEALFAACSDFVTKTILMLQQAKSLLQGRIRQSRTPVFERNFVAMSRIFSLLLVLTAILAAVPTMRSQSYLLVL